MKVLLLTNPRHVGFLVDYLPDILPYGVELLVKYTGEYDWSESYDIGISFMYQYRVPAKELSHTWFNFHPAPLPEYKGRNLCYHAIMNGEKEFGATVHYMDEGFDTGDIIDTIKFPVKEHWTARDVSAFAIQFSRDLFKIYLPRIIAGEEFERLPNVGGVYYPKQTILDEVVFEHDETEDWVGRQVRAITCGDFYPKVDIGGVKYKIVRDE